MQLVLLCKSLSFGVPGAGAASLLRARGGNPACRGHDRQHEEIRARCKGQLWGGGVGRQHRYAFNFMSTSGLSTFLNLALRVQQKIVAKER